MTAWALDENGRLSGSVTFDNLAEIRRVGETRIREAQHGDIAFDCSGLEEASSVAVALLVAWHRAAGRCGKSVTFRGASLGLRNIAEFSGLGDLLSLEAR